MIPPSVKDRNELIEVGRSGWHRMGRELLIDMLEEGIEAVNPYSAVKRHVSVAGNKIKVKTAKETLELDLDEINRIFVVGAGKATALMASSLESILGEKIELGAINVPAQQLKQEDIELKKIKLFGAGHPIPTIKGVEGAREMVQMAQDVDEGDLVFCLISGGGSALLPLPAGELKLEDLQVINGILLECGAKIHEINTIRKHLSNIKGGWLAKHFHPARVISLILSDVVGDDLSTIASGPTVPDPTTFQDAITILKNRNVFDKVPENVKQFLKNGESKVDSETPKPGDSSFNNVTNIIIGSAKTVASRIVNRINSENSDMASHYVSQYLEGEARAVGIAFSHMMNGIKNGNTDFKILTPDTFLTGKHIQIDYESKGGNSLLIFTGETTVTIKGNGKGGRNQELLLSILNESQFNDDFRFVILSCGLDGIEGNSPAAGALIDNHSREDARENMLEPGYFLENNDSFTFFSSLNSVVITGPTGTNVNDLTMILVEKGIAKIEIKELL
ncbi:MAG: glycerate kinase [Candidatus Hodarchaeota archaeon]